MRCRSRQPHGKGEANDRAAVQDNIRSSSGARTGRIADAEGVREGRQGQPVVAGQGAQARRWAPVRAVWSFGPLLRAARARVDDVRGRDHLR